jgi:hypothetical protein
MANESVNIALARILVAMKTNDKDFTPLYNLLCKRLDRTQISIAELLLMAETTTLKFGRLHQEKI